MLHRDSIFGQTPEDTTLYFRGSLGFVLFKMASLPIYENQFLTKFSLKERTVIITGGGRGLGLTFANGLAQAGADIAIVDIAARPSEGFSSLAYGGKYQYYQGDVTDYANLGKIIEQISKDFGGIHGW